MVFCLWRITDQVCLGKKALSGIHELCESFQKHVYGYELSCRALVANVRFW